MRFNKNWTGNKTSVHSIIGAGSHSETEREQDDYYATDPTAIDDLFEKEDFAERIWEPACGEGHLAKRMEQLGKEVYATDLIDRGYGDEFFDFLESDKSWDGDIITNPPYKYAQEFIEKAMESISKGNKLAMFLKLLFLESKSRIELFDKYPPKRIWVYSERKTTARNGEKEMFKKSSAVCYAWFVWAKGFNDNPRIGWIKDAKQWDDKQEKLI